MPHFTERTLHLKKIILTQKRHCEVSVIIAMNQMFKLAVFNIQHLKSNRDDFFAFIFFFALSCRKD